MSLRFDASCLLLSAALAAFGLQRVRAMREHELASTPFQPVATAPVPEVTDADSLDDAAATIVANDPFRLSNRPPSVRFAATNTVVAPVVQLRPQLAVRAIIGGPPWSAIVEGIPGQAGATFVTPGAAFDVVRIRSITRETVVVQAPDTTWTLTMKGNP